MVIDFSQPSALRQFELVASDGKSLWANGFYLAEISPYFYALCVAGDFKERQLKRAELRDVNYDDLHELLRCVCPEDYAYENKIKAENFALLTNLSGRLLLQNLRSQLEEFARVETNFEDASTLTLLEVIVEIMEAGFDSETIATLCRRLAKHDRDEVKQVIIFKFLESAAETVSQLIKSLPEKYCPLIEQKIQPFLEFYHHPGSGTICGASAQPAAAGSPHHWNNIRLFF